MAKLSVTRLVETSRMLRTQAGQDLADLLTFVNDIADQTIRALRQKLTYGDNFDCSVQTVSLIHNTEQVISFDATRILGEVRMRRVVSRTGGIQRLIYFINNNKQFILKATFNPTPTRAFECSIIIYF